MTALPLLGCDSAVVLSTVLSPGWMPSESVAVSDTHRKSDGFSHTFEDADLMEKQKLLITFWLLFVPVAEMFCETKSLMRSNASVINERCLRKSHVF